MDKNKNIFIKMDEFFFQKLDFIKNDGSFQKINDLLAGLEEEQQKLFAQLLTFGLILLPYLFVATLWWGNHKSKQNIEVKNQILEQISVLNGNKDALANVSASYVSPSAISGQEDLDNKIRNIMSSTGIEQNKVTVKSFNLLSTTSSISKIEANLSFQNFGTQDFSSFMSSLVEQEKFKIERIDLVKNKTNNLLQGEISLMHLGRTQSF